MSSITDYFERMHRKEHLNPSSHWFTIAGGILFMLAGAIAEIRTQDLPRALSYVAIGLGMTLFGVTQTKLRTSPLRVPALLAEVALWFGGVYWLIYTMF
jgi:sulfite exporter TauE/SafE